MTMNFKMIMKKTSNMMSWKSVMTTAIVNLSKNCAFEGNFTSLFAYTVLHTCKHTHTLSFDFFILTQKHTHTHTHTPNTTHTKHTHTHTHRHTRTHTHTPTSIHSHTDKRTHTKQCLRAGA